MNNEPANPEDVAPAATPLARPATASRGPSAKQIAIVVVILAVGVVVTALTSDVTRVSEPGIRLVDGSPYLPDKLTGWEAGELVGLTENERQLLPADTMGARRPFTDPAGNKVFSTIVLAGREVTSIHRPELCLPGQGWKIDSENTESIPVATAPGGVLKVMRMNMQHSLPAKDGSIGKRVRYIFVYWFVGKDRVTPYHWQRIMWTTEDRVFFNRNHRWAYILLYAPVASDDLGNATPQAEQQTMQLLSKFVQNIYPELAPK
jgi:hypothetical protein